VFPVRRNATMLTNRQNSHISGHHHTEGTFGGFPGPFQLAQRVAKRLAPNAYRKIERKMTMPYTRTIEGAHTPWLTVDAAITVGRNSDFHTETLEDEVIEKIGGAEYKALRWLSYLVPIVSSLFRIISVIVSWFLVTVFRYYAVDSVHSIHTLAFCHFYI